MVESNNEKRGEILVFAIGDLHFDSTGKKPMGIFGENWKDHEKQIKENWKKVVDEDSLVLLPGDISWALKHEEAYLDLKKIENLPGRKIMIKGNHDYWWDSLKKINNFNFKTIDFVQNNSFVHKNIGVFGTRGWGNTELGEEQENSNEHNIKVFKRELNRLKLSLDSLENDVDIKIVMLHYPPFNYDSTPNEFADIMEEYKVDICVYGHLHGEGHKCIEEGNINGVEYYCVASDYIEFKPKKII